jgi:3-oxoacyl-[acyl-carrier-protein] synthase-3
MNGMEIFNFSVTDVVKTIMDFMLEEDVQINDTDFLFLHQANKFMTDKISRKLGFPKEKVPYSLGEFGNTSSASIPLTIAHHFSCMQHHGKAHCLLSGFGVGLSWGVVDIILEDVCCPEIGEL